VIQLFKFLEDIKKLKAGVKNEDAKKGGDKE